MYSPASTPPPLPATQTKPQTLTNAATTNSKVPLDTPELAGEPGEEVTTGGEKIALEPASQEEKVTLRVNTTKEGPRVIGEIPPSKATARGDMLHFGVKVRLKGGPPSQKQGISVKEGGIILNYDQAPIAEVIAMIGKFLGINYMIDPTVKGTVNLHTYGGMTKEELWPIFLKILRMNNLLVTERDRLYEIYPLRDSQTYDIPVEMGEERVKGLDEMFVIQIVRLGHILADDMAKILGNFTTTNGKIIAYPEDNLLFLIDQRWSIRRMMEFVKLFDVSQFSNMILRMYEIRHVPVSDLTKELETIIKQYGVEDKRTPKLGIRLISLQRLNSLFVISGNTEVLEKVEALIEMLDVSTKEDVFRTTRFTQV